MDNEVSKGRPVSTPIEPSAEALSGFRTLEILSDLDLGVSLSFGLVYVVPAEIKSRLLQRGLDLSAPNGFSFWMLPMPATYVLDQRGIIRRACVGPDSITGATTETVLASLSELDGPKPRP